MLDFFRRLLRRVRRFRGPETDLRADWNARFAAVQGSLTDRFESEFLALRTRIEEEVRQSVASEIGRSDKEVHSLFAYLDGRMSAHSSHLEARTSELLQDRFERFGEHVGDTMHRYFAHIDQRLEDRFLFGLRAPPQVEERDRILELTALLRPMSLVGHQKIRVGSNHDGGYVLADNLDGVDALSLGIADDVSWDLDMARRGYAVHQFDHTVEGPPEPHERFAFHKLKIVAVPEEECITISQILSGFEAASCPVLKIDIEGDEWGAFAAMDETELQRFDQIVCEFHGFGQIGDDVWFRRALDALTKLSNIFAVVHVHANNYGALLVLGNVPFPELLEVTFVNRKRYDLVESSERFPNSIDMPNRADRPDIELFDFKFGLGSILDR